MTKETIQIDGTVKLFDEFIRLKGLDFKPDMLAKAICFNVTNKGIFPRISFWIPTKYSASKRIGTDLNLNYFVPPLELPSRRVEGIAYRTPKLQSSTSIRGLPGAIEQAIGQIYEKAELQKAELNINTYEEGWKTEEPFINIGLDLRSNLYTSWIDKRHFPNLADVTRLELAGRNKDFFRAAHLALQMYGSK